MRVIFSFFIVVLLNFQAVYSQSAKCNCEKALQKLVNKIETEYPGFADKTKDKYLYDSLKESLKTESKKADDSVCLKVLQKYIVFFKDPHLLVSSKSTGNEPNSAIPANLFDVDLQFFQQKIQNTTDRFEGIWRGESYKVGIKKAGATEYVGFIIKEDSNSWKPKEIKFKLHPNGKFEYFMMNRSAKEGDFKLIDDCFLKFEQVGMTFVKELPKSKLDPKVFQSKLDEMQGFYFKKLTPKTSILAISSFNHPVLERVKNLISNSIPAIETTENLIIDIRDNGGGTDSAYTDLMPYIVTNPYRVLMAEYLSTQTYIDHLENYLKSIKDPEKQKDEIADTKKRVEILKANLGKFVSFKDFNKDAEPVSVVSTEPAKKSPKQIIVLVNKGVGSAAENFVYKVRQSKKVKLFGLPTYGALDYANSFWSGFGCENYQIFMPTYRATRLPDYPVDNIGFQPDVYLDSSVKDWIDYTVKYVEN